MGRIWSPIGLLFYVQCGITCRRECFEGIQMKELKYKIITLFVGLYMFLESLSNHKKVLLRDFQSQEMMLSIRNTCIIVAYSVPRDH